MCFSFAQFEKKSFEIQLYEIFTKSRTFLPNVAQNPYMDKNLPLFGPEGPQDGLYGSNEPKRCKIRSLLFVACMSISFQTPLFI